MSKLHVPRTGSLDLANKSTDILKCSDSIRTIDALVEGVDGVDDQKAIAKPPRPLGQPNIPADLWQEAIEKVRPKLPIGIDFDISDRPSNLKAIFEEAEQRQHDVLKGQKKLPWTKSGKAGTYREVYGNIIKWVKKFQIIGDIAIQADAGYASLPWALVRVFIMSAAAENDTYSSMLEGMELVSNLIYHYAVIEQAYSGQNSQLVTQVRKSIVSLYVTILQYLTRALDYFGWSSTKRFFRTLTPTANDKVKEYLSAIDHAKKNVDTDAMHANDELSNRGINYLTEGQKYLESQLAQANIDQELRAEYLRDMVSELQAPLSIMTDKISDMHDQAEVAQLTKIFDWLSVIQPESYHNALQTSRLRSSGKWLLTSIAFRRWLQSPESSLLWMYGILGSGKTNLASIVIDHLRPDNEGRTSCRFAFFYCSRNEAGSDILKDETSRAEPLEALRSIVKQLSGVPGRADLELPVKEKYQQLKTNTGDPRKLNMSECVSLIAILSSDIPTTIVIDALDECNPATRSDLIRGLNDIISRSSDHVKIFLTTRRLSPIARLLDQHQSIEVTSDRNGDDIRNFVITQLENRIQNRELLDGDVSEELKADIQKGLVQRAEGMFWYASLQLSLLCDPERLLDEETVREMLAVLPSSLEELYARIIDDINQEDLVRNRVTAQKALKWLLCARMPLSCSAFLEAVSSEIGGKQFRPSKEFVINACKTLVVIDEENETFQFAHLSVREYLEKRADYSNGECHLTLAESCLGTVDTSFGSALMNQQVSEARAQFSQYASLFWPVHYQNISFENINDRKEGIRETLKDLLIQGQDTTPAFKQWLSKVHESTSLLDLDVGENKSLMMKLRSLQATPETSLFTACVFGFPDVIEQFGRNRQFNFDLCNVQQQNALCLAVENDQMETVEALLSSNRTNVNGLNVLAVEAFMQLLEKVQRDGLSALPDVKVYASALQAAAVRGFTSMATYLLAQGANVGLVAGYYGSPLQAAALNGHESLVSLFLDRHQAEPNSQGGFHGNALQAAATCGNAHVIALLVDKGASVATSGGHYDSALMAATCSGSTEAVKVLLNAGADINIRSKIYGTPVSRAADMDNEDLLQLLIKKGADINAYSDSDSQRSSTESGSALAAAAWGGHEKIVSILLKNGARTDLGQQGQELHILHQAAICGMIDLAAYCLDSRECNIDMLRTEGRRFEGEPRVMTPLSFACAHGRIEMVRFLLARGASFEYPGDEITILYVAARRGHMRIVSFLVEESNARRGPAVTQEFIDRRTPKTEDTVLHEVARFGSVETVTALLNHNAVYRPDRKGATPLHSAAWRDRVHVVQLLLERSKQMRTMDNFDIDARNMRGDTALMDAAQVNAPAVLRLLLAHGADFTACGNGSYSALHYAASRNHLEITKELLSTHEKARKQLLEIRNANRNTALNEALSRRHLELSRILLSHGARWYPNEGRESILDVAVLKNIDHARQYLNTFADFPEQLQNFLDSHTPSGRTALHLAAEYNQCEAAKLLLGHGANYAALSSALRTPLHWATQRDHVAFARILLDTAKTSPDASDTFEPFINQISDQSTTALHEAVTNKNIDSVTLLLSYGADISQSCPKSDNQSALHLAIARTINDTAMLRVLLEHAKEREILQPLIDIRTDKSGNTALFEASNMLVNAELLLRFGADYSICNKEGASPLHAAAWHGHREMAQLLLGFSLPDREQKRHKFRAFVDRRNHAGYTALCMASERGHVEMVSILLREFRAEIGVTKPNGCTPFHLSVSLGHLEIVGILLLHASKEADDAKFRRLLNHRNQYGKTALMDGAESNRWAIVELLLNPYAADCSIPDNRSCSTLHVATSAGNHDCVELLLKYGARDKDQSRFRSYLDARNDLGKTALMDALERDRSSIVDLLLGKYGVDYSIADPGGCTALHWGVFRNRTDSVELLLSVASKDPSRNGQTFQAFLDQSTTGNQTALMDAINQGLPHLVDLLLNKYHASYHVNDPKGFTILHIAAGKGNSKLLEIILAHVSKAEGAEAFKTWINKRDEHGRTALSKAIAKGDAKSTKLLFDHGAV